LQYKKLLLNCLILLIAGLSISCKKIPTPGGRNRAVLSKTSSEYHTVSKGDTLFSISRQFDISVDYLQKVNNIKNPNFLHIGQKLYVGKKEIKLDSRGDIKKDNTVLSKNVTKNTKTSKTKKNTSSNNKNINSVKRQTSVKAFMIMPSDGEILYKFGDMRNGIKVEGLQIKTGKDTSVKATASGDIVYVDEEEKNKIMIIDHKNNFYTVYSDLSKVTVKMGDVVKLGEIIGNSQQGKSYYFELKRFQNENNPVAVNPQLYILHK
jgi:murein DD-endopeptidase MepM/ murein hydrolase activator NlpD